jgi:hypothetical protein
MYWLTFLEVLRYLRYVTVVRNQTRRIVFFHPASLWSAAIIAIMFSFLGGTGLVRRWHVSFTDRSRCAVTRRGRWSVGTMCMPSVLVVRHLCVRVFAERFGNKTRQSSQATAFSFAHAGYVEWQLSRSELLAGVLCLSCIRSVRKISGTRTRSRGLTRWPDGHHGKCRRKTPSSELLLN